MALGLTLGIVLAVSGGNPTRIDQSALGSCASPSASAGAAGTMASAAATASPAASPAASPCPSTSASAMAGATVAADTFRSMPGRADLAGPDAQDAAGTPINFNQTPAQAAASMNCVIQVPPNPLTAQGLATPWVLGDGCNEAVNGATEGTFVEATILSPNGQLQVYNPLVIDAGTTAAVTPTPPTIPQGSQVIISLGFNGNAIVLTGAGARQGRCIDAFGNSIISQTPQCNAPSFYRMANFEIARGMLKVPPPGTSPKDMQACQTTENFALIDQDQSDNVDSTYLVNPNTGQVAQDTAANTQNLQGFTALNNGSDDGLLDAFVDPSLGCTPFTAPDTTAAAGASSSQALNALSSRQAQENPRALDPVNDPQLLVAGQFSIGKTNTYRLLTDQPLLPFNTNTAQNAAAYCQDMVNVQTPRLKLDSTIEANFTSPVPAIGNNLANFLAARENASFTNLNCQNFGLTNPITLTLNGNVAVGATYNTTPQTAKVTGAMATPTPTATMRNRHFGRFERGSTQPRQFQPGGRAHM